MGEASFISLAAPFILDVAPPSQVELLEINSIQVYLQGLTGSQLLSWTHELFWIMALSLLISCLQLWVGAFGSYFLFDSNGFMINICSCVHS